MTGDLKVSEGKPGISSSENNCGKLKAISLQILLQVPLLQLHKLLQQLRKLSHLNVRLKEMETLQNINLS